MSDEAPNLTRILQAAGAGDRKAAEALLPAVYDELRALARSRMSALPPGNTLQPTALVHEAYLRVVKDLDPGWDGRGHFFAAAAQAMRDILVDQARRKSAVKHGGGRRREAGNFDDLPFETPAPDMLALDEALTRLQREDETNYQIVMLRFFGGLTAEQAAEALELSTRTVERRWRFARALLHRELMGDGAQPEEA